MGVRLPEGDVNTNTKLSVFWENTRSEGGLNKMLHTDKMFFQENYHSVENIRQLLHSMQVVPLFLSLFLLFSAMGWMNLLEKT